MASTASSEHDVGLPQSTVDIFGSIAGISRASEPAISPAGVATSAESKSAPSVAAVETEAVAANAKLTLFLSLASMVTAKGGVQHKLWRVCVERPETPQHMRGIAALRASDEPMCGSKDCVWCGGSIGEILRTSKSELSDPESKKLMVKNLGKTLCSTLAIPLASNVWRALRSGRDAYLYFPQFLVRKAGECMPSSRYTCAFLASSSAGVTLFEDAQAAELAKTFDALAPALAASAPEPSARPPAATDERATQETRASPPGGASLDDLTEMLERAARVDAPGSPGGLDAAWKLSDFVLVAQTFRLAMSPSGHLAHTLLRVAIIEVDKTVTGDIEPDATGDLTVNTVNIVPRPKPT